MNNITRTILQVLDKSNVTIAIIVAINSTMKRIMRTRSVITTISSYETNT